MEAGPRRLPRGCVACFLSVVAWSGQALCQEYIRDQEPAPKSAEEIQGPIAIAFPEAKPPREPLLPQVKQSLEHLPPFLSETQLDLNIRNYYFLRDLDDNRATLVGLPEESEAWALGGSIAAQSGWQWDRVALGGELFTSLPIYAPEDRPGTGLLKPIQDPIFVAGQGYLRLRHGRQVVTLYRQRYDLPYINSRDSRMIPNTFEGYSIDGHWPYGRFVAGYIRQIKLRASDNFISMSRAAGVRGEDRGLAMLGMRYDPGGSFWVGAIASVVPDVLSTVYSELDTNWSLGEWGFRIGAQFSDQRSVGDNLLTGSRFDTQSGGARVAVSFRHAILTTAFSVTSAGARIRNPFGGNPSFTSLMLRDFTLANEKAFKIGLSYDCGLIGLAGLSGFVNYARGFDPEDARASESIPEDEEIDLTLDIRPSHRLLRGLWLRLRAGVLNPANSSRRVIQARVIINGALPLL